MANQATKAQIESFCKGSSYHQAKTINDKAQKAWSDAGKALNDFIDAQGPNARAANGLTSDYVRAMPEYRALYRACEQAREQAQAFTAVFVRVFAKEHKADIIKGREERARDNNARWAALCA